jgi:hypothetical protein
MVNYVIKINLNNKLYSIYIDIIVFHDFSNFQKNQDYMYIGFYIFLS